MIIKQQDGKGFYVMGPGTQIFYVGTPNHDFAITASDSGVYALGLYDSEEAAEFALNNLISRAAKFHDHEVYTMMSREAANEKIREWRSN